jgi:hypothetical protein
VYDALFTVLYDILSTDVKVWTKKFKEINQNHLKLLTIRCKIHSQSPAEFAYGTRGTSVTPLTAAVIAPHDIVAVSSLNASNVIILDQ